MTDDPIITVTDAKRCRMCVTGTLEWFRSVGLGDRHAEFIAAGLPASVLLATGDGYAEFVVRKTIERECRNG
jgi:hypothetical protein